MKKTFFIALGIVFLAAGSGWGISNNDLLRLRAAGISDETLQVIIRERALETCAFSVQELIDLKTKGGVSDKTIRLLLNEGSFMKNLSPVVYGRDIQALKFTTLKDILELKEAGLSDEIIQAIIISGSGSIYEKDREKAWDMLKQIGIVMDTRK